jgi:hypothetical protein
LLSPSGRYTATVQLGVRCCKVLLGSLELSYKLGPQSHRSQSARLVDQMPTHLAPLNPTLNENSSSFLTVNGSISGVETSSSAATLVDWDEDIEGQVCDWKYPICSGIKLRIDRASQQSITRGTTYSDRCREYPEQPIGCEIPYRHF